MKNRWANGKNGGLTLESTFYPILYLHENAYAKALAELNHLGGNSGHYANILQKFGGPSQALLMPQADEFMVHGNIVVILTLEFCLAFKREQASIQKWLVDRVQTYFWA